VIARGRPKKSSKNTPGDLLIEMANGGNLATRVVIETVAELDPRAYGQYRDQLDDVQEQGER
jgi:hypothetical protein